MGWLLLYMLCGAAATAGLARLKNRSAVSWVLVGFVAIPAILGLCAGPVIVAFALGLAPIGVPLVLICSRRVELPRPTIASLLPLETAVRRYERPSTAALMRRSLLPVGSRSNQDDLSHRAADAVEVMDCALADAHDKWKREHDIVLELKIPSGAPDGRPCVDCRGWVDWPEPRCPHCGASRHGAGDVVAMVIAGLHVTNAQVEGMASASPHPTRPLRDLAGPSASRHN